ncbi:TORTIFOLIA1-like protein 2 isoform X2 [Amaranthus tricolor]|uniref:TORTIFOLIA1-like protein 2 isoform X2 n=1 Tax=Amaranthus tricolor TaxID=29722 RepID=UPI0025871912|nr:TORTIFOLIA1-like protein 2 isoform X2 [Amaranthus tricolor]
MKQRTELKTKGPRKLGNSQQIVYELKHRVVLSLNKISDRDTYQIGVQELEKLAESLKPDGMIPFLSCILDSDSEQKSAVRKECVRMMGVLVKLHGDLVGPHLGKMVASIVKRLKDQDTVVRDTCVDTMGVFAAEFGKHQVESDGIFVLLVRPFFEALGDQNKQIQTGAALCLARVIDNIIDPPISILQKILARSMKLLKNPHFKAKPSVIELNKSLIQAGGALSHSALSTSICSIQGALKDNDWTTRKAASLALGEIASRGGPLLAPFRASCVQALESCRFDKVKPVRETVLQALHCWRSIERKNVPECSDTMSTIKDSPSRDDYGDLVPACSSLWKDIAQENLKANFVRKRAPVSTRKLCSKFADTSGKSNECEWHVGVAVPKMHPGFPRLLHNDESESSSACKTQETITADVISMQGIGYEYDLSDEKQEYTSVSNHVSDDFTNKFMSSIHRHSGRGDIIMSEGSEKLFLVGKTDVETEKSHTPKMEDRRSLDSTVTEAEECDSVHVYCSQTENEISSIRKQLLEIEKKQSNLMDLFQGFAMSTMDTLSVIQSKVSSLEHAVDKIAHDVHDKTSARPLRKNEIWEGKAVVIKSKSKSIRPCLDSQRRPLSMVNRNFIGAEPETDTAYDLHSMSYHQNIKNDWPNPSTSPSNAQHRARVKENGIYKHIKGLLCEGDIDSAYREALYSGDQQLLIELIDGTGPVLDRLSNETINNLLTTLASYVSEHIIIESIYPWLQQVVDLSGIHGPNCVPLSMKVRREILSALQKALDVDVTNPTKRRMVAQLAMNLQQIWG